VTRDDGAGPPGEVSVPLRWADVDALGHVYHATYLTLLDEARSRFLAAAGVRDPSDHVVARVEVDYLAPVGPGHREVLVRHEVERVGSTSIALRSVLRTADGVDRARAPCGRGALGRGRVAAPTGGRRRARRPGADARGRWHHRRMTAASPPPAPGGGSGGGPGGASWADRGVERAIREAQARGEFDGLPGAGKPLRLGDPHDADWWVKQLIQREQLSLVDALPPAIRLRREAEQLPETLARFRTESAVRAHLEDLNARVEADWRRPAVGPFSPVVAHQVDVERWVGRWRDEVASRFPPPPPPPEPAPRRRWWHRLLRHVWRRPADQA
jgi:acyl-CoA thioesterase FadM